MKGGADYMYIKPSINVFESNSIVEISGVAQTAYPVQFSIQAIQFQVSHLDNTPEIYKAEINNKEKVV
jgi:hypothetical protein